MQVKELKTALRKVKPFVSKTSTLPILRCVRLHTEAGQTWIHATNLDSYVKYPVKSQNGALDPVAIPYQDLVDIAGAVDVQHISLANAVEGLAIEGDGITASVEGLAVEEFPLKGAETVTGVCQFRADLFEQIAERVAPIAADDEGCRPILEAVCLEITDDRLIAVAADGFMLAWQQEEYGDRYERPKYPASDEKFLFPARALASAAKLIEPGEMIKFAVVYDDDVPHMGVLLFDSGVEVVVMLEKGTFPDWRQILPLHGCEDCNFEGCEKCDGGVVVASADLKKGLKTLSALTKRMGVAQVKFDTREPEVRLAVTMDGKTMTKRIPALTNWGDPGFFCANPKDVFGKLLAAAQADKVVIEYQPHVVGEHGGMINAIGIRPYIEDGWNSIFVVMHPSGKWVDL